MGLVQAAKRRCGDCEFGLRVSNPGMDIAQSAKLRTCWGAPPTPVLVPGPNGFALQTARAMVGVDEFCALFERRTEPSHVGFDAQVIKSNGG